MGEGAQPGDVDSAALVRAISASAPELSVSALAPLARGWSCQIFVAPEGWVVRVPLSAKASAEQTRSLPVLRLIAGKVGVATPVPAAEVPWQDRTLLVYRRLPGAAHQGTAAGAQALGWVREVVDLVRAVQALDPASLAAPDLAASWAERAGGVGARVEAQVLTRLPSKSAQHWRVVLERALAAARSYTGPLVLLHGDLDLDELLCEAGHLVGVTDWDEWTLGDPAWELRLLWPRLWPEQQAVVAAGWAADHGFLKRLEAYAAAGELEQLLNIDPAREPQKVALALRRLERR